jgi:tetratricopeptide (TPR) repeat protein
MSNTNLNSDLLVDYLDNYLSPEEKNKVEAMIQKDATIESEYDNLLLAKSAIQYYGIKQQVASIHKQVMADKIKELPKIASQTVVRKITKWSMRIAASLLVVMLGLGVYQYATVSSDKLFAKNYSSYTLGVTRGETTVNLMEKSFQAKDYNAVINQYAALNTISQKENFLVAQAYLETKKYSRAIEFFNAVLEKNTVAKETIFNDDAEYFLAMSYLKNNDIKLAMPLFEKINNNTSHLYNDKVTNGFMRSLKLLSWKK